MISVYLLLDYTMFILVKLLISLCSRYSQKSFWSGTT